MKYVFGSYNINIDPTFAQHPYLAALYRAGNNDGDVSFEEATGKTFFIPDPQLCDEAPNELGTGSFCDEDCAVPFVINTYDDFVNFHFYVGLLQIYLTEPYLTQIEAAYLARRNRVVVSTPKESGDAVLVTVRDSFDDNAAATFYNLSFSLDDSYRCVKKNQQLSQCKSVTWLNGIFQKQFEASLLDLAIATEDKQTQDIVGWHRSHSNRDFVVDVNCLFDGPCDEMSRQIFVAGNSDGDLDIYEYEAWKESLCDDSFMQANGTQACDIIDGLYRDLTDNINQRRYFFYLSCTNWAVSHGISFDPAMLLDRCLYSPSYFSTTRQPVLVKEAQIQEGSLVFDLLDPFSNTHVGTIRLSDNTEESGIYFDDGISVGMDALSDKEATGLSWIFNSDNDCWIDASSDWSDETLARKDQVLKKNFRAIVDQWFFTTQQVACYKKDRLAFYDPQAFKTREWHRLSYDLSFGAQSYAIYEPRSGHNEGELYPYCFPISVVAFLSEANNFLDQDTAAQLKFVFTEQENLQSYVAEYNYQERALYFNADDKNYTCLGGGYKGFGVMAHEAVHMMLDLSSNNGAKRPEEMGVIAAEYRSVADACSAGYPDGLPTVTVYAAYNPFEFAADTMAGFLSEDYVFDGEVHSYDLLDGPVNREDVLKKHPRLYLAYTAFLSEDSPARFNPQIFSDEALPLLDDIVATYPIGNTSTEDDPEVMLAVQDLFSRFEK